MDFSKVFVILFVILSIFVVGIGLTSVSADNVTITPNSSNIFMKDLVVVVHVTIKNTQDHPEFFKISQTYFQIKSLNDSSPVDWNIDWTDPPAVRMATNVNNITPEGDLGWEIEAGETKTVSFKLSAIGTLGTSGGWIIPSTTTPNQYWPLIPDPGLAASWFQPNELSLLNPDLQITNWEGDFAFNLFTDRTNLPRVEGLVRAPIVPLDSQLSFSDPQAFIDKENIAANTATWDVTLFPGDLQHYEYSYTWPMASNANTNTGSGSTTTFQTTNAAGTTVPSPTTGVPYGLLAMALIIVGAGIGYAKFFR